MKASLFLKQVLNKVGDDLQNRAELEAEIEKLNFDLPDALDTVANRFESLMTESAAQSKSTVATKVISKYNDNVSKAHSAKMQGLGFSDAEISEVLQLSLEERLNKIAEISTRKAKTQFSVSESERVQQEEARARSEKERADRIQAQLVEREQYSKRQMDELREQYELRSLINTIEINNNIPTNEAYDLIMNKVRNRLQAVGAKIINVHGSQRLVQASDEALDYYDDKNNKVSPQQFIESVARDLNLLKLRTPISEPQRNISTRVSYTPNNNGAIPKGLEQFNRTVDSILNSKQR